MSHLRNVLFDYGNTLIAFGPDQIEAQAQAMIQVIEDAGFQVDVEQLNAVRKEQIRRPYSGDGKENVFSEVCREIIELATPDPSGELTKQLMLARRKAFLNTVSVDKNVVNMLARLKQQYRLGFLSNYPDAQSIKASLIKLGLYDFFDSVVISADVGYAKPHPKVYAKLIDEMNIDPAETVYVGDNWLADVQGSKRAGMRSILVTEHVPYETFKPGPDDFQPDGEILKLTELEVLLSFWS